MIIFSCTPSKKVHSTVGLSFETAIKVNSIEQEYRSLEELCSGCDLEQQGLGSKDNKYYDIMRVRNSNGESVEYYFDITNYYGKYKW